MDLMEAMRARHSVRKYLTKPIEEEKVSLLNEKIAQLTEESGLHFALFLNEPEAFSGKLAHYGSFVDCNNYISISGAKGRGEDVGYYGEKLVLFAQQIGLHTCWVALTYNHSKVKICTLPGEKLHIVISIGYGANRGVPHKNKPMEQLCCMEQTNADMPEWFRAGVEGAMTAPTAMNQQKFHLKLLQDGITVSAKAKLGPYSKMDLGIVKYHFEIGVGNHPFCWEKNS